MRQVTWQVNSRGMREYDNTTMARAAANGNANGNNGNADGNGGTTVNTNNGVADTNNTNVGNTNPVVTTTTDANGRERTLEDVSANGLNNGIQNPTQIKVDPTETMYGKMPELNGKITLTDTEQSRLSYDQMKAAMDAHDAMDAQQQAKDEEARRKEEKRRKSAKIISAIGDGLSAMSNVYFAGQYGTPDMLGNSTTMSASLKKQWDEEDQRRMAANKLAWDQKVEQYKLRQADETNMWNRKFKEQQEERQRLLNEARVARYESMNAKTEADRVFLETKARLLEAGFSLKEALNQANIARINALTAQANSATAKNNKATSLMGADVVTEKDYTVVDKYGKEHNMHNKTVKTTGGSRNFRRDNRRGNNGNNSAI